MTLSTGDNMLVIVNRKPLTDTSEYHEVHECGYFDLDSSYIYVLHRDYFLLKYRIEIKRGFFLNKGGNLESNKKIHEGKILTILKKPLEKSSAEIVEHSFYRGYTIKDKFLRRNTKIVSAKEQNVLLPRFKGHRFLWEGKCQVLSKEFQKRPNNPQFVPGKSWCSYVL